MIREDPVLGASLSSEEVVQALIEFVAWCCAVYGNQAGTISGKLAAIQYFHRVDHGRELPISSELVKRALQGVTRAHVRSGTRARVRHPVSWKCLLDGQGLAESWGPGGRVLWLSLALSFHLLARSDEMFASARGDVNPVHCLTRDDVAFYDGSCCPFTQRFLRALHSPPLEHSKACRFGGITGLSKPCGRWWPEEGGIP